MESIINGEIFKTTSLAFFQLDGIIQIIAIAGIILFTYKLAEALLVMIEKRVNFKKWQ